MDSKAVNTSGLVVLPNKIEIPTISSISDLINISLSFKVLSLLKIKKNKEQGTSSSSLPCGFVVYNPLLHVEAYPW